MCVRDVDVQCVLQFTLINAAGCALHRRTSRVIHRLESFKCPPGTFDCSVGGNEAGRQSGTAGRPIPTMSFKQYQGAKQQAVGRRSQTTGNRACSARGLHTCIRLFLATRARDYPGQRRARIGTLHPQPTRPTTCARSGTYAYVQRGKPARGAACRFPYKMPTHGGTPRQSSPEIR